MTTVREVMSTEIVSVEPSSTVAEAATAMGRHQVGSAIVVQGGELAGIFTERDIVRALAADFDAPGHPVSQWMSSPPRTVAPEVTVEEALERMLSEGFRHLPVVEEEILLGIVSIRDLSAATAGKQE